MVDENLGGFLQGFFREDRAIGGYFDNQLFVVGFLVYAEILNSVLDVLDRGINRVDGQGLDILYLDLVFIGRHPAATLVYGHFDSEPALGSK